MTAFQHGNNQRNTFAARVEDSNASVYNLPMTIKLPKVVEERLRDLAKKQKREVSALVEDAISEYIATASNKNIDSDRVAEPQLPLIAESHAVPTDKNGKSGEGSESAALQLRHRELEWRQAHRSELSQYANQWVVLEGEQIVAHDVSAAQAIRRAKAKSIKTPYVFFVEPESDSSVLIGL